MSEGGEASRINCWRRSLAEGWVWIELWRMVRFGIGAEDRRHVFSKSHNQTEVWTWHHFLNFKYFKYLTAGVRFTLFNNRYSPRTDPSELTPPAMNNPHNRNSAEPRSISLAWEFGNFLVLLFVHLSIVCLPLLECQCTCSPWTGTWTGPFLGICFTAECLPNYT